MINLLLGQNWAKFSISPGQFFFPAGPVVSTFILFEKDTKIQFNRERVC